MAEKSGGGRRRYGIIAACAVLALAVICGAYWMGRSAGNGADVGEEAAKLAALGHAQVSEGSLTRYGITRDRRGGKAVYEVEFAADGVGHCEVELDHHDDHHGTQRCEYEIDFKSGGYEYEYKIDAVTGEILQSQREWDD